ncbi:MAG: lysophospholipid acyltransferase family protein [Caldilineaceae bacterium]|jgi:1-acyl-sn-glycerol-3-phosphate acyltransferase
MIRNRKLKYPHDAMWLWKVTWVFGWTVYPLFFRYRIEGEENLPDTGGAILACNHNYGIDFILLGATARRQVYFMAKAESFRQNRLLTSFLYNTGVFPVEREKQDIGALRKAVTIIREGKMLGMFPEGTRSKDGQLQRGRSGTARIAFVADAPVVPAAVIGSPEIFKDYWKPVRRPEVIVRYGPPLHWDGDTRDETASKEYTDQIMLAIAALLPPEMRGVYRDKYKESVADGVTALSQA